jgi:hypothetical protein
MRRKAIFLTIAFVLLSVIVATALPKPADQSGLTVHEWGTFTSVAGVNGEPVPWRSYGGPSDLPCFVERFGGFKRIVYETVRMETPVLYFYGSREISAAVKVLFPKGTITEWFPKATLSSAYNTVQWHDVRLLPNGAEVFPVGGANHYYAARKTDAVPLRVGSQNEKFLFYRGIGSFPLPISAVLANDGKIAVKKLGDDAVSGLILFENRAGKRRYRFVGTLQNDVELDLKSLPDDWAGVERDLEQTLVGQGLYSREARAMLETWRDSWFEEGTRLFYIVPQRAIDSILPLTIQPAPSEINRVFVGRMEIITPMIQSDVQAAIAKNDRATLEKYGRFLEPIAKRVGTQSPLLDSIYSSYIEQTGTCVK